MIQRFVSIFSVAGVLLLVLAGCGGGSADEDQPLRVGVVPNQNPQEVEAKFEPLGDYLSEKIGRKVEVTVPTSYNAVVESMVNDELDLAYFGGLSYVQARQRANVTPLVTEINPRTGDTTYHSLIIAPASSAIQKVDDIKGKNFAFGSVSSTSGSLYPAIMLQNAGIDYRKDLGNYTYTNGHDATAQAVANDQVDAGGLEDRILYKLEADGKIDESAIRIIKESDPIEGYPWVVRDAVPDDVKNKLVDAYLNMNDKNLLDLLNASGYKQVKASDYDYVEEKAKELDLLTSK